MLLSQLLMLIYGHPYMFHFYIQADCVNYLSIPRMLVEAPIYNHTSLLVSRRQPLHKRRKGLVQRGMQLTYVHAMMVFDVHLRNVAAR